MIVRTSAKSTLMSAGLGDDLRDAAHRVQQHVVGLLEGLERRGRAAGDLDEALVRDHDQRVDGGAQLADALFGLAQAAASLEAERLGDDADGQRAEVLADAGDDGSRAGAGAAAHAGGHEHHVGAAEFLAQDVFLLERGLAADFRVGAGAEALGQRAAELDLDGRQVGAEACESVLATMKSTPASSARIIVRHRVAAAAADAHHHDTRVVQILVDQARSSHHLHRRLSRISRLGRDA